MDAISTIKVWRLVIFSCFCLIGCSDENATQEIISEPAVDYLQMEIEIQKQINDYRLSQNLPALESIDLITVQADGHNNHMIANGEVCHHGFGTREKQLGTGLGAQAVAENVGYGFQTAEGLVQAWLHSVEHKKNIE